MSLSVNAPAAITPSPVQQPKTNAARPAPPQAVHADTVVISSAAQETASTK